jgi:uncharacterized protein
MTDTFPPGAPCWLDLLTSDPAASQAFYPDLLGWTAGESSPEFGGYFMFFKDGIPVAGGMPKPDGMELPDEWGVYLAVEDAHKTVEVARAHGATITLEPMVVADLGTSVRLNDPNGVGIGMWQADTFPGFGVSAQPGAPAWFELHTRGYDDAVAFYRDTFGWDTHVMSDVPEFRYTTLGKDDDARAGIMDGSEYLPDGTPGAWKAYFAVDDTDAALARATELGASVVLAAEDTPYGRLAELLDPTGAAFKLLGPNAG